MADRESRRKGTENRIRGGAEELQGKVKKEIGDVTDDRSQQVEGGFEELRGKARKKLGESQQESARKSEREEVDRSRM